MNADDLGQKLTALQRDYDKLLSRNQVMQSYISEFEVTMFSMLDGLAAAEAIMLEMSCGFQSPESLAEFKEQVGILRQNADDMMQRVQSADLEHTASLLSWNQTYEIGYATLDAEHRSLLMIMNQLFVAITQTKETAAVGHAFDAMVDYTKTHLSHEEQMMQDADYPDYPRHLQQHHHLIHRLQDIFAKYQAGEALAGKELLNFLANWWNGHITTFDMKFSRFLQAVPPKQISF